MSWCEGGDHWSEVVGCGGLLIRASGGRGSGGVVREPECACLGVRGVYIGLRVDVDIGVGGLWEALRGSLGV